MNAPLNPSLQQLQRAEAVIGSRRKLGATIDTPTSTIQSWFTDNRLVPAEACPKIEEATAGQVTRSDLRPDLWPPGETLAPLPPSRAATLNDLALEVGDTAEQTRRVLNGGRG